MCNLLESAISPCWLASSARVVYASFTEGIFPKLYLKNQPEPSPSHPIQCLLLKRLFHGCLIFYAGSSILPLHVEPLSGLPILHCSPLNSNSHINKTPHTRRFFKSLKCLIKAPERLLSRLLLPPRYTLPAQSLALPFPHTQAFGPAIFKKSDPHAKTPHTFP